MSILIVDDSKQTRDLIEHTLKAEKLASNDIIVFESAAEVIKSLAKAYFNHSYSEIDLILLDIEMPDMNGIDVLKKIKDFEPLENIPVIMVTAKSDEKVIKEAFDLGAMDYITKPFTKTELFARVRSALRLKNEIDRRDNFARKLEEANKELERLTLIDGLTKIANRRHFDQTLEAEWDRGLREAVPLSVIMIDIDYFKLYNDTYGHQTGDKCLQSIARSLQDTINRSTDLVARYGGEEFVIILPNTKLKSAYFIADKAINNIAQLKIPHKNSALSDYVTVSMGVATFIPDDGVFTEQLIKTADNALYLAKQEGRNRVKHL